VVSDLEAGLSYEAEEYIETIYRLQKRDGAAKTKELAEALSVVPGSITNTIEHLERHDLVVHEPYRGVKLTKQGEKIALGIIRRHRLAERMLTDMLNAQWSSVHEEACKLEHALTKKVAALLEARLGYPKFCPHGNPIPTESGLIDEQPSIALTDANVGESYVVVKITDEEQDDLELLAQKRILPTVTIQVERQDSQDIYLQVEGMVQTLSIDLATTVMVRKKEANENAV
jgi:DtxR family Mn-dependent transcriptional regulator